MAATTTFTSCSKDDDKLAQDPLVGNWVENDFVSISDVETRQEPVGRCDGKDVTAEFCADGTFTSGKFEGDKPEDCVDQVGTWEKIANGNYLLEDSSSL